MKNANYNLVKMLLAKLDDVWRVERFYSADADEMGCSTCRAIMDKILEQDRQHVEALRAELAKHISDEKFD
jgi:hypothetical protein